MKKQVVSISGGETSHYTLMLCIEKFGAENVEAVICDTCAEHPGTYDFVRDTIEHVAQLGVNVHVLRMVLPSEEGVGVQYEIIDPSELKTDYKAFKELMAKYGRPYMPGGKFCTTKMKTEVYRKFCDEYYGKGQYTTWIGYRAEPKDSSRVWGAKLSALLSKHFNITQREQGDFYIQCREMLDTSIGTLVDWVSNHINDPIQPNNYKKLMQVVDRVVKNRQIDYRFLFEISDMEKSDITEWWQDQPFKLSIPPHCGNCVFCIEKSVNQLAYLCHTQPDLALEWQSVVSDPNIAEKDRKEDEEAMYRGKMTFDDILTVAFSEPLNHWEELVIREKKMSPCAGGSCESYNL